MSLFTTREKERGEKRTHADLTKNWLEGEKKRRPLEAKRSKTAAAAIPGHRGPAIVEQHKKNVKCNDSPLGSAEERLRGLKNKRKKKRISYPPDQKGRAYAEYHAGYRVTRPRWEGRKEVHSYIKKKKGKLKTVRRLKLGHVWAATHTIAAKKGPERGGNTRQIVDPGKKKKRKS